MAKQHGNFGKLAQKYDAHRPKYPAKALSMLEKHIPSSQSLVLDLGCGTGISTRQLAKKKGIVIGCDVDQDMISVALSYKSKNTAYTVAPAERLPFSDDTFDVVTMFNSFHWFSTKKSLKEIKRVLRKRGKICIVQARFFSPFAPELRSVLSDVVGKDLKPRYRKTRFEDLLKESGLSISSKDVFVATNSYSLSEYVNLVQSYSVWNDVPEEYRPKAIAALKKSFKKYLRNGKLQDKRKVHVLIVKV